MSLFVKNLQVRRSLSVLLPYHTGLRRGVLPTRTVTLQCDNSLTCFHSSRAALYAFEPAAPIIVFSSAKMQDEDQTHQSQELDNHIVKFWCRGLEEGLLECQVSIGFLGPGEPCYAATRNHTWRAFEATPAYRQSSNTILTELRLCSLRFLIGCQSPIEPAHEYSVASPPVPIMRDQLAQYESPGWWNWWSASSPPIP